MKQRLIGKYLLRTKGYRNKILLTIPEEVAQKADTVVTKSAKVREKPQFARTLLKGYESAFGLQLLALTLYTRSTLMGQETPTAVEHIHTLLSVRHKPPVSPQTLGKVWEHIAGIYPRVRSAGSASAAA